MVREIDPKKLVYFATVVKLGSLSRAAALHRISQPAMSLSMDRLEEELGTQVLRRSPHGVVPTAAGEVLYGRAQSILDQLEQVERDLEGLVEGTVGPFRLGTLPSLACNIIPVALSKWSSEHTQAEIAVVEQSQPQLLEGLMRREHDVVVARTEMFDLQNGLMQQVLFRDVLRIIARPGHPLGEEDAISWPDLMRFPWISPSSGRSHIVLEQLRKTHDHMPSHLITACGSVSMLKAIVASSDHLALLPAHAIQEELTTGRLAVLPFEDDLLNRKIAAFFWEGFVMKSSCRDLLATIKATGVKLSKAIATASTRA